MLNKELTIGQDILEILLKDNTTKKNIKKVNFHEVGENKEKSWQSYVWQKRLEIACGEAPYLTTRCDAATGEIIDVKNRIGLLDRKLRVIGERVRTHKSWLVWTKRALQSTYGYDWQGDNVLLARKNVLFTVMEHYAYKYEKELAKTYIIEFVKIMTLRSIVVYTVK